MKGFVVMDVADIHRLVDRAVEMDEFIEARLDEEESRALSLTPFQRDAVLVRMRRLRQRDHPHPNFSRGNLHDRAASMTLSNFASIWRDHADYDPRWRPVAPAPHPPDLSLNSEIKPPR
ncbi:hypothetical protein [Glutamicibacter sp. V16R2B1]|uniref:hypothetical protein n=1 Tax=Glutamicibacter sp. V16R2B1 TaxID=2036207 RepID=UPI0010FE9788|nr:hypothetical protein [Glutamicibacter sp. V16R2B1]MCK9901254.1 hypothetical protein [Frankia sp. Cpl3]TLK47194.1 hypothetical protein FDN03_15900 [Glutamicibacter sp. V16R2B1]